MTYPLEIPPDPLNPADLQLLMMLHRQPMHAYGLTRESEKAGNVKLEIGSLYRMLSRLMEQGLIAELPRSPDAEGNEAKRKYYQLTPVGRRTLRREALRLKKVVEDAAASDLIRLPGWSG